MKKIYEKLVLARVGSLPKATAAEMPPTSGANFPPWDGVEEIK
jgi:hypothetical protein